MYIFFNCYKIDVPMELNMIEKLVKKSIVGTKIQ